ncbi:MAG: glucans biosynthesis glucosyltransferase MdoH [Alphaproteobacteria bacterium]
MTMTWRRRAFAAAVLATVLAMSALMARALSVGGFDLLDLAMLLLFATTVPWYAIGFWNGVVGLALWWLARDPVGVVAPFLRRGSDDEPIATRTAIVLCIRNEEPARIFRVLADLLDGLAASGHGSRFHAFVLSDTDDAAIAEREAREAAATEALLRGRVELTYRRRRSNEGFKAGNIRDFCERWGAGFDHMVTLDADSVMTPEAVLRLVRIMQREPTFGIVQTLVVGMPSTSAFARLFQFGMRLGMRSYTLASAAWQGDCGPYWGHNAIIRMAPFVAHCRIAKLPGKPPLGGEVLSHDQIEAAMMRRAGFEVRVIPEEGGSWEANPPTLLEFIRRDLRWCQGNMQYGSFIAMPGIAPVSRFHLGLAMLMYFGAPAWTLLLVISALRVALGDVPEGLFEPAAGNLLLALVLGMVFAPKIATAIDVLVTPARRHAFGGAARFLASFAAETVYSLLIFPITTLAHAVFMAGLPFHRTIGWSGQSREDHVVPARTALRALWRQTALGLATGALFLSLSWEALAYGLLGVAGLALAVPFAVVTSLPGLGLLLVRLGIGRLPEETEPPGALVRIGLPALARRPMPPAPALGPPAGATEG